MRVMSFKYRIYPTAAQLSRIASWQESLRFLWNLANEQYLNWTDRPKGERAYPTAFSQAKELSQLRRENQWLRDVPRNISEHLLATLHKSWRRCFSGIDRAPHWKRKSNSNISLTEPHATGFHVSVGFISFPKLGDIRAIIHRPILGQPRICTIKLDGDQWFAVIVCRVDVPEPIKRVEPSTAIDRGITNVLADSDGNLTPNPRHYERAIKRLAHAQRVVSRRKKGSKNREKAKLRVMRLHRKVRRQREHFLHVLSHRYAKSHGVVVIENLNVAGMVRARPLSRSIANAGWSTFAEMLRYKLAWSGGSLVEVPAQYSSQTCSACGAVDATSRKGEHFCCTTCGHRDHADTNAAKVLKTRASRSGLPVEGSVLEAARRSRKQDYASTNCAHG